MKWRRVPKERAKQPKKGNYKLWKELIAKEGFYQCVYCALPEPQFGGVRNFHVEHYKPRSIFKDLENDIKNLFYACPVCNVFKGDSWLGEPLTDHSICCFPNPSAVDYNELFELDFEVGIVKGKFVTSRYLVSALHLNRTQLIWARRLYDVDVKTKITLAKSCQLIRKLESLDDEMAIELLGRMARLVAEIASLEIDLRNIRPYTTEHLR